jgi:competence protein ComEA
MRRILAAIIGWLFAAGVAAAPVDANTASREALQTIRGIGPVTAARIVEERRRQPFRDPQDLARRVKGIGEVKLRKITEAGLTVGGNAVQIAVGGGQRERKRRAVVIDATPAAAGAQGPARREPQAR